MANAIEQKNGLTVGYAGLGLRSGGTGSVRQQVHDGDTITIRPIGNLPIRFLGTDAPEISFPLPKERRFRLLSDPKWKSFLKNPFSTTLPPFRPTLSAGLADDLKNRIGPDAAQNQYDHAVAAQTALEEAILGDIAALKQTKETFQFFLAFAYEIMDRYGRFLGYLNRLQPDDAGPRPLSYNERLLKTGHISPYFIWPNVNPYRRKGSIVAAVVPPGKAQKSADRDKSFRAARESIRQAREKKIGIFDASAPLRLQPFEVRFLARRSAPDRWVIDLSKNDDLLIQPQNYYTVPNVEDRLYIPEESVPLFVEAGWRRQRSS